MTKKWIFTFSFVFICVNITFSQGIVAGRVLDLKGSPIMGAEIKLSKLRNDSLVRRLLTDTAGTFKLDNLPLEQYNLWVGASGYTADTLSINLSSVNQHTQVKEVRLRSRPQDLDEVVIFAKKDLYEQKIDRVIMNIKENSVAANGTAIEALQRAPGVMIDNQKNSVSLNGKDGILIMIDGKMTHQPTDAVIRMLSGMNAVNIQKIELISNPPAEYDASGSGGIINIVLNKNKMLGFSGTYTLTAGYGLKEKLGGNLDFNYGSGRYNIYGNVSYLHNRTKQIFSNRREFLLNNNLNERFTTSDRMPVTNNLNARFGIDVTLDSTTTFGASFSVYNNLWNMRADNAVNVYDNFVNSSFVKILNSERNHWQNFGNNIYINKKFRGGTEMNLDLNYLIYHNDDPTYYLNSFFDSQNKLVDETNINVKKVTPVKIGVIKFDLSKVFTSRMKFKTGVKTSLSDLSNMVSATSEANNLANLDNLNNNSTYNENIGAIYSELSVELNKSTRLNSGIRYEYSHTNLNVSGSTLPSQGNFSNFFPSIFLSKRITENNTVQLSYSRRITRPSYSDLAPYVIFLDPATYFYGNMALKPSISSTYKLDYIYRKIILSFQYVNANNAISSYQATVNPQNNQQIFTSVNLDYLKSYSIILSLPGTLNDWWEMQLNLLGVHQDLQTAHLTNNLSLTQNYIRFNSTQSFKISSSYSVDVSGTYQSKKLGGISSLAPRGLVDIGLQKKYGNNIIRFSCSDIFNSNNEKLYTDFPVNNLNITEIYKYEPRIFRISISHKFGNSKKRTDRETGIEEIKSRLN